ncbi:protein disulfide-isomerase [Exophiala viscosa]|uniref:Protein disulfide-isomerase n=1 Tax=Exophiala viscosa TaxID=2486360 RepID=A0AAN6DVV3_9EURO|nr:protein disulfide-isomerase [Exophiala viscosa]KAI1623375.1 protein disulfide-isomerase [Exophiala viscosa]
MTNYNITCTSDIVCPWCYVGHSRLSKAIAEHRKTYPNDKFHLKYMPFYLNPPPQLTTTNGPIPPPFPVESRNRRDYYAAKFGPERAKQIEAMMIQTAAGEGLNFSFGGKTGISRNGHRLVHWAQNHGGEESQNEVMLGLWRRYFEQEVDITTLDTLIEIGLEAGLGTKDEIKAYLESGKDGEEVDRIAEEARLKGISGVPHYEINDHWEVSGAQDPLAFRKLFVRWKDLEAKGQVSSPAAQSVKGNGCL